MQLRRRLSTPRIVGLSLASVLAILALAAVTRAPLDRLELRLYDRYLEASGPRSCPQDILAVAPEEGKSSPEWSEAEAASALRLLREFDARRVAIADRSFGRESPRDKLEGLRARLPGLVDAEFDAVEGNVRALFGALRSGTLPPKELGKNVDLLASAIRAGGERLKAAVVAGPGLGGEAGPSVQDPQVLRFGSSVGGKADEDGVLRSIALVRKAEGAVLPSYELASLADYLGSPALELTKGRVLLQGCTFPDGRKGDLSLPVDEGGRFRMGWSRPGSAGSPRLFPMSDLRDAIREEAALVADLERLEERDALGPEGIVLMSRYRRAELLGSELDSSGASASAWRDARQAFFEAARGYFQAPASVGAPESADTDAPADSGASEGAVGVAGAAAGAVPDAPAAGTIGGAAALREECLGLVRSLQTRRRALAESVKGSYVFLSPRPESSVASSVYGGATNGAIYAASFAAAALSGRGPVADLETCRAALACLFAVAAIVLGALSLAARPRRSPGSPPEGLLRRAEESRAQASRNSSDA